MEFLIGGFILWLGWGFVKSNIIEPKNNSRNPRTYEPNPSSAHTAPPKPTPRAQEARKPPFIPPPNYKNDPEITPILNALRQYKKPILVTGKAGTGKSTLVKFIRDSEEFPNTVVLAPTGVAAINITGQTIHSFFRLPPRIFTPDDVRGQSTNKVWSKVDLIIVDEISMVRSDIIDGMDYILRKARKKSEPFGGAKVLFVGDFHQLPPVIPDEEKKMMDKMGYVSGYAYAAKVFSKVDPEKFELQKVHRQSEEKFLSILSDIRNKPDPSAALKQLNAICHRDHREDAIPMLLTGTNATASRYNAEGLAKLETPAHTFTGKIEGKFNLKKDKLPAPEIIDIKVGARVMTLMNDKDKRWVNGSLGTVNSVTNNTVKVLFDHSDETGDVKLASWENIRYVWDEDKKRPIATVIGSYTQIPLNFAWAVTIHKSQGLTLDDVRVDLERGAFASGQTYVALSRARTLSGLSLASPLKVSDIIVERKHDEYLTHGTKLTAEVIPFIVETTLGTQNSHLNNSEEKSSGIPIFHIEKFSSNFEESFESDFNRECEITYVSFKGRKSLRNIKVKYLIHNKSNDSKYLVGLCSKAKEMRSFKVDRIERLYDKSTGKDTSAQIEEYLLGIK